MKGMRGATSPYLFDCAALSERGGRESNEDAIRMLPRVGLFMVADGMGGHRAGEVASLFAITSMANSLATLPGGLSVADRRDALLRAVTEANREVHARAGGCDEWKGMGTTLVAALWCGDRWAIASVGDSRAYILSANAPLRQITEDHRVRQNILYRALGTHESVEVDMFAPPSAPGDMLLLCTDGLYEACDNASIERVLRRDPPREAAKQLLQRALDNQARDNVSAIVVIRQ